MRLHTLQPATKLALSGFLLTLLLGCLTTAVLIGLRYSPFETGFHLPQLQPIRSHYSEPLLVSAMKGSMYQYVADDRDIATVAHWIQNGAAEDQQFHQEVMPILKADCESCHSRTATRTNAIPSLPFSHYADLRPFIQTGAPWTELSRSSHIHLFGISLLLVICSLIFSCSRYTPAIQYSVIILGWLALWLDIASWWLAKTSVFFTYVIVCAGTVEIATLVGMSGLALLDLWGKAPALLSSDST